MSVLVCVEDVVVTERFTYLDSDIHVSAGCGQQTSGSGLGSHGFTGPWGVALPVLVQEAESLSSGPWCFQSCSTDVRLRL